MAGGAKFGTCPMARQRPSLRLLSTRSPSLLPPLPRGLQWDPPALAFAFHTAFIDCEDGRVLRATGEAQGCATPSPALCTAPGGPHSPVLDPALLGLGPGAEVLCSGSWSSLLVCITGRSQRCKARVAAAACSHSAVTLCPPLPHS